MKQYGRPRPAGHQRRAQHFAMNNSANCSYGRSVICGSVRLFLVPGFADRPSQRFGGGLRRDVTLRRSEQFEANHEFSVSLRSAKAADKSARAGAIQDEALRRTAQNESPWNRETERQRRDEIRQ